MAGPIPSHARVVIIGGGIVGCSVAYHLTKLGWRDVLVLERRQLSCGTTWHAAGLVGQLRSSHNLTRLASYGAVLYEQLEAETGQATGFRRSGSVSVARTAERTTEPNRGASMPKSFGVDVELTCPCCATPTATSTCARRSADCSWAASSRWPSHGAWAACRRISPSRCCPRTGSTSACSWSRRSCAFPRWRRRPSGAT